jgi:large-conductance mechanosensitive channel
MSGFKKFVMQGNVVELAVAFVLAAAVGLVVKAFVDVIMSLVGKIGGEPDFNSIQPGGRTDRRIHYCTGGVRHPGRRLLVRGQAL